MTTSETPNLGVYLAHEEMRDSQIEMIVDGIDSLSERGFLLAAAPTGIGKTAASLASALHVANNRGENGLKPKIVFMTGRQSQHRIVVDTVRMINSRLPSGIPRVKLVDIIGREGMCEVIDKSTGKCDCEKGTTEEGRQRKRGIIFSQNLNMSNGELGMASSRKSALGQLPDLRPEIRMFWYATTIMFSSRGSEIVHCLPWGLTLETPY